MSWYLIAETLVDKLQRYNKLSDDAKYLLKHYLLTYEREIFWEGQTRGVRKAVLELLEMYRNNNPGKDANFCWHCGKILFFDKNQTPKDIGALINMNVMYSGYLCIQCQSEPNIHQYFLDPRREIHYLCEHIAKYGVRAHKIIKKSKTYTEEQYQNAIEEIEIWIEKIYNNGSLCECPPKEI